MLAAVIPTLGCGDDIKFPDEVDPTVTDPALNAVIPANGFTARTIRVQISGDGTEFSDAAQVVFGTGITVDEVELASPSSIFATITIAADAPLGAHDVIVTDGDATLTLSQAFEVSEPIEVLTVGALQQGGFAQVVVVNRDSDNPFLGVVDVTAGTGTTLIVNTNLSTEFLIFATVLLDTDAATGPVVVTDTLGNTVVTSQGGALTVAARTAVPLQAAAKGNGLEITATMNGTNELFSFSPTSTNGLVTASVFTADPDSLPFMIFLLDGKWANARGFVTETIDSFGGVDPIPATGTEFVLIVDDSALTGFSFTMTMNDDFFPLPNVTQVAEAEPNDVEAQAGAVGASHLVSAVLNTNTDEDFFKITGLLLGQQIRVQTTTGLTGLADTQIEIIDSAGLVVGSSGDDFNGEGVTTAPLPAGDYFVVVSAGFFGFAGDDYEAAIDILPAISFQ